MPELSVLIPARNEMFLKHTVEDVLTNMRGDSEIIVVADGEWPIEGLAQHPRVQLVHLPVAIGQRAATNLAARVSEARFIMKVDGHVAVSEGFDTTLIEAAKDLGPTVTQIPTQFNLHVFNWVCDACKVEKYQGPTPTLCAECGSQSGFTRRIVWHTQRRKTETWRFDSDLKFGYFGAYQHRPEAAGDITDTMSCLGACWFLSRERYWELGGLDEGHGSWGQMGTELACKSWLSGGRMVTNKRAWFSHMFRTQGGDFGFPFPLSGTDIEHARRYSQTMWRTNSWPGQVKPLRWLVEKFSPVPGWTQDAIDALPRELPNAERNHSRRDRGAQGETSERVDAGRSGLSARVEDRGVGEQGSDHSALRSLTKGIVYYSDCRGDESILTAARSQLQGACNGYPIVSATLKPLAFGRNLVIDAERGYLAMFRQILAGLEALDTDVAFLCEHDVLYHPSHFEFTPPRPDAYFYNLNVWKVNADDGRAVHYRTKQTSGLCANRELLIQHYRKRIARVEKEGFSRAMGFEPGSHKRKERIDDYPSGVWWSKVPNIDIRHGHNLTASRWSREQFRDQRNCEGWTEADAVPGWGVTRHRFRAFLADLSGALVTQ